MVKVVDGRNCFLIIIVVFCCPFAWHADVFAVGFVVLCGRPFHWTWDCMHVNVHVVISVCPLLDHEREDFFRLEVIFLVFRACGWYELCIINMLFLVFKSFVFTSFLSSLGL